jgi:hypothetical protein
MAMHQPSAMTTATHNVAQYTDATAMIDDGRFIAPPGLNVACG